MSYSPSTIAAIRKAPKTLGNQLGRWAVHLDFPVLRVAEITGATRMTVYNWFKGGEVFVLYRPTVRALLDIFKSSKNAEEAWAKSCKAFNLPVSQTTNSSRTRNAR
jgi:hypothetical protein